MAGPPLVDLPRPRPDALRPPGAPRPEKPISPEAKATGALFSFLRVAIEGVDLDRPAGPGGAALKPVSFLDFRGTKGLPVDQDMVNAYPDDTRTLGAMLNAGAVGVQGTAFKPGEFFRTSWRYYENQGMEVAVKRLHGNQAIAPQVSGRQVQLRDGSHSAEIHVHGERNGPDLLPGVSTVVFRGDGQVVAYPSRNEEKPRPIASEEAEALVTAFGQTSDAMRQGRVQLLEAQSNQSDREAFDKLDEIAAEGRGITVTALRDERERMSDPAFQTEEARREYRKLVRAQQRATSEAAHEARRLQWEARKSG